MFWKEIGMSITSQTINEERGARKAAELRRRFRNASKDAGGSYGFGPVKLNSARSGFGSRREYFNAFLIWVTMAAVIAFFGFVLF